MHGFRLRKQRKLRVPRAAELRSFASLRRRDDVANLRQPRMEEGNSEGIPLNSWNSAIQFVCRCGRIAPLTDWAVALREVLEKIRP